MPSGTPHGNCVTSAHAVGVAFADAGVGQDAAALARSLAVKEGRAPEGARDPWSVEEPRAALREQHIQDESAPRRPPARGPERDEELLELAARSGHAAAIAALLAAGAEINAKKNNGMTALMWAAQVGHAAAIAALLAAGAEVDAKMDDGTTALEIAELRKHEHAARLLRGDAI